MVGWIRFRLEIEAIGLSSTVVGVFYTIQSSRLHGFDVVSFALRTRKVLEFTGAVMAWNQGLVWMLNLAFRNFIYKSMVFNVDKLHSSVWNKTYSRVMEIWRKLLKR